jgi:hypothetical protein
MGSTAQAAVPTTSSLEGVLLSSGGGPAADGNYTVTIGIYSAETGGNPVWAESGVTVAAKGGQFSYQLGSKTPLSAAALSLSKAWIGIQIGSDPELPRQAMASSPFALRAGVAEALECTGCLKAGNLDAAVLQPYAKSADLAPYAKTADLSGYAKTSDLGAYAKTSDLSTYAKASDLADYVKAASLAKVAGTGSYADLLNKPTLATVAASGSYADLTNKPVMAKLGDACGTGLVMKGLKADGSYDCVTAGIAADLINEVSNDLIWNQFVDSMDGTKDVQIKDGFAAGVTDTLAFPDVGLTQKLWVNLNVSNSDVSKVVVELYGPGMSTPYLLYNGGKTGSAVVAKYNDGDALVSGDMNKDWLGKNIKGNWSITVKDTAAITVPPGTPAFVYDGKFNWSIGIQTLSSKKIQVKGNAIIDGDISIGGNLTVKGQPLTQLWPVLRWGRFSTYDQNGQWYYGNTATWTLGIAPSTWTDGGAYIWQISADKNLWRTVLTNKMNIYPTMTVMSEAWYDPSSTNGKVLIVLFRIKNTTGSAINWAPAFWHTNYGGWGEYSSITVNGAGSWSNTGTCYAWNCQSQPTLAIPANRTSSVMFAITSGPNNGNRSQLLTFYGNTLTLPNGLSYVDDLDTATGGWEQ